MVSHISIIKNWKKCYLLKLLYEYIISSSEIFVIRIIIRMNPYLETCSFFYTRRGGGGGGLTFKNFIFLLVPSTLFDFFCYQYWPGDDWNMRLLICIFLCIISRNNLDNILNPSSCFLWGFSDVKSFMKRRFFQGRWCMQISYQNVTRGICNLVLKLYNPMCRVVLFCSAVVTIIGFCNFSISPGYNFREWQFKTPGYTRTIIGGRRGL